MRYEGREVTLQLPKHADLEWAVHEAMHAFSLLKSRDKVSLVGDQPHPTCVVGWAYVCGVCVCDRERERERVVTACARAVW